jgi:peptidoglycan/LPS O-acetylase OafA/YrhL
VRTTERLLVIDVLRGVAALAVVVVHLPFSWNVLPTRVDQAILEPALPGFVTAVTDYGRFGVHLFLVISGFCIHLRVASGGATAGVDFVRFWKRRLTRLYPPYFFALVASLAGLFALIALVGGNRGWPAMFGYSSTSLFTTDMLQLLTLTQTLDTSSRVGNAPFWTLALEEQLYVLYFVLLLMRRRLGWRTTLLTIAAVTFAWRAVSMSVPAMPSPTWQTFGPARWIEWALGALAVDAYFGRVVLPAWTRDVRVLFVVLAAAVAVNAPAVLMAVPLMVVVSDAAFGLVFFILINWAVSLRASRLRSRWVRLLGGVGVFSYSLYLTHEPVVVGAKQLALRLGLTAGPVETGVMLALRLAAAVAAGLVFYWIIERRAIEASRRLRTPVEPAAARPAVA